MDERLRDWKTGRVTHEYCPYALLLFSDLFSRPCSLYIEPQLKRMSELKLIADRRATHIEHHTQSSISNSVPIPAVIRREEGKKVRQHTSLPPNVSTPTEQPTVQKAGWDY